MFRTSVSAPVLLVSAFSMFATPGYAEPKPVSPPSAAQSKEAEENERACRILEEMKETGRTILLSNRVGQDEWQGRIDKQVLRIGNFIGRRALECASPESLNAEFSELTRGMQQIYADYAAEHGLKVSSKVDGIWGKLTTQDFLKVAMDSDFYRPFIIRGGEMARPANFMYEQFIRLLVEHDKKGTFATSDEISGKLKELQRLSNDCTGQVPGYTGMCGATTASFAAQPAPHHG